MLTHTSGTPLQHSRYHLNFWTAACRFSLCALTLAGLAIGSTSISYAAAVKQAAVATPDFAMQMSPASVTVTAGSGTGQFIFSANASSGFSQPVKVSISNIPAGIAVSPATFSLNPGAKQAVSILASTQSSAGSRNLMIEATGGNVTHTASLTVSVTSSSKPLLASTIAPTGASLSAGTIPLPAGFMKSVKDYGAVGNGTTDDTSAIQAALSDGRSNASGNYYGLPKALYFPPGTYLVSNTLSWNGCCVTLQGAGPSASIIRLAPSSAGFNNPSAAKPLIQTPAGNNSFRQNIYDIGFKIGANNPGAVGLDYISNNNGSVHDVSILSEDLQGVTGIAMIRHYPGPLMLKNVSITGFQTGIATAAYEYGPTIEGLTLANQSVAGIYNQQQTISVRNLKSSNAVPAIVNNGGFALVLDATLCGGASSTQAVQNTGSLYLRDISSAGYGATLQDTSVSPTVTLTGKIVEYVKGAPQALFSTPAPSSLNLGVSETPTFTDTNMAHWAAFTTTYYGDTKSLQTVFNSGANTIYFPFAPYLAYNEAVAVVPDTVNRVVGFSSIINGNANGINGGGIRLVVNSNSTVPLIVEQFGYGLKIEHHGTRPVVIKNGRYTYTSFAGAGNIYFEDVELPATSFQASQSVWIRQLDDEAVGTKITNAGTLWVLGIKTEQAGTIINTTSGGNTEVLGNLLYPAQGLPANSVAFQSTDAKVSYIYSQSVYCTTCGYATQVWESRSGSSAQLTWPQSQRFMMHLYVGY